MPPLFRFRFDSFYFLLLVLLTSSFLAVSLVAGRFLYWGRVGHFYLVWNLFLAWIPLGMALLAWHFRSSRIGLALFSFLWLIFFPNAPYLVTDLVHLKPRPPIPLWFDLVLLQSFVCLGLVLGYLSLYKMQKLVSTYVGSPKSWAFVICVIGLTGFGIYLGRFQRWNSWDLLLNPGSVGIDLLQQVIPPRRRIAATYSFSYALFFFMAYLSLYTLTHIQWGAKTAGAESDRNKL